jgi:transposase
MKLTKKDKEELSQMFDISISTFYNWEKTKPRLIEIIKLGLQKEKEQSLNIEQVDNEVETMKQRLSKIEEQMKLLEEQNK